MTNTCRTQTVWVQKKLKYMHYFKPEETSITLMEVLGHVGPIEISSKELMQEDIRLQIIYITLYT